MSMIKADFKVLLQQLCAIDGISGFEQEVVKKIASLLRPLCNTLEIDCFGNIYAVKRGSGKSPCLMLAAHADEVGGIVRGVLPNGLIQFYTIGFVSETVLPATKVRVAGVSGVVGAMPAHLEGPLGRAQVKSVNELYIDVGARNNEEVRAMGIGIGSPISFISELIELGNSDRLCGKAIDDRVGCAVLLQLMHEIKDSIPAGDVWVVITVQEETSMSGARIAANRLQPNLAIAIDTVPANDTGISSGENFAIGAGPVIQLVEGVQTAFIGTIIHPIVKEIILKAAAKEGVPIQFSVAAGHWTTDGSVIHSSGQGVPTGFVSIPRRYAHSPGEVLDINDALNAVRLLKGVVAGLEGVKLNFID